VVRPRECGELDAMDRRSQGTLAYLLLFSPAVLLFLWKTCSNILSWRSHAGSGR
jgi:hypothetical protein